MASKTTEALYRDMQDSYTKTAEKISATLQEYQTKYKVPPAKIQKLMHLYDSYQEYNLLIQMYDIHRTVKGVK